jgi:hypothetical protein
MDWYEARNWCKQKKMRLAELKKIEYFNSDNGLKKFQQHLGKKRQTKAIWIAEFISLLFQVIIITGWVLQTLAGRLDNSSGKMGHRWTIPLGGLENLTNIDQE